MPPTASRGASLALALSSASEPAPSPPGGVVERILQDSASSEHLMRIMRTLTFRLESCAESLGSGRAGGGLKALSLLRSLLLGGAEAVLTASLDLVAVVARILRACERNASGSGGNPNLLDPPGSLGQVRLLAATVMSLLLDQRTLTLQRQQRGQRLQEFR